MQIVLIDVLHRLPHKTKMTEGIGWTPERVEALTHLWDVGASASMIAANLGGVSRSAVIGKARRLGLKPTPLEVRIIRSAHAIAASQGPLPPMIVGEAKRLGQSREGQAKFRSEVLARYVVCAITGCETPAALQAAHIIPHRLSRLQNAEQALLLRADIHALYDAGLIAIAPYSHHVLVSASLDGSEYQILRGTTATFPNEKPNNRDLAWNVANVFSAIGLGN